MSSLSDATLDHLRAVADWPDLSGTRYEVVEAIGRGGMGTVYRARDRQLGRDVALKVVDDTSEPDLAARLLHEAGVIARLEHPGIVPVHDAGRLPDGRLFYAMKLVVGRRLDDLAGEGLALPDALSVFERLAETVAFAHARGVVHRDLKPENVMVGAFGEVLVMDWGLAKVLSGSPLQAAPGEAPRSVPGPAAPITSHGTILGTPGYMAPEQERGDSSLVDERTDVWALGALLHFLLERAGASGAGPKPLAAVCDKAMAPAPPDRYASAEELAADVARFRAGLAVAAYREGPGERLLRFGRRHRTPLLLVAAYLVMRVLLVLLFK